MTYCILWLGFSLLMLAFVACIPNKNYNKGKGTIKLPSRIVRVISPLSYKNSNDRIYWMGLLFYIITIPYLVIFIPTYFLNNYLFFMSKANINLIMNDFQTIAVALIILDIVDFIICSIYNKH